MEPIGASDDRDPIDTDRTAEFIALGIDGGVMLTQDRIEHSVPRREVVREITLYSEPSEILVITVQRRD